MKGTRRKRSPFQSRGIRFLASACVVGALILVGRIAPGDSPHTRRFGVSAPEHYYLFAANGGGTGVSVYAVGADGSLHPGAGPFAADEGPSGLAASPTDRFLYVANAGARSRRHHYGDITAFSVGSEGLLSELPSSPFIVGGILRSLAITPNGKDLYTISGSGIWTFAIQPNGVIKRSSTSPVGTGRGAPQGLAVAPDGTHLYTVNLTLAPKGTVSIFSIGPHGTLRSVGGSPVADGGSPTGAIATTPDGKHLYVGNNRNITAYSVRSDGGLRLVGSYGDGVDAGALMVGPAGHFLYAGDSQTGTVRSYRIDAGGRLALLGGPVRTGANSSPDAIVLTPDGRFLYVADSGSNAISAFHVSPAGALYPVEGSPYSSPRGPDALAVVGLLQSRSAGEIIASGLRAAVGILGGVSGHTGSGPLAPVQSPPSASCRKDPLAGVYHPRRLHLNDPCLTVSGIVERVKTEADHDWHVNLLLAPSSQHLINAANRRWEHGDLLLEIIPMDQHSIPRPKVGERITVTGAYVLDTDHGWEEIHPVWLVDGVGSVGYTAQAAARSVEIGIRGNESYYGTRH